MPPLRSKVSLLFLLSWHWTGGVAADEYENFEKHIRPVLAERCYSCHSAQSEKLRGGLYLDSREGMLAGGFSGEPAIVPGDAEGSQLVLAIRQTDDDLQMPPKGKLPDEDIQHFIDWINSGAPDPRGESADDPAGKVSKEEAKKFWSFQPPVEPAVPPVANETWPRTEVDRFILARLEANGLEPSPEADQRTLIRRATYDLLGLPPTPEEVEAFEKDGSPEAYARLIDRLLDSPHYGERWGRYWLDVARYADTKGYVYDDREEARFVHSRNYRDWVVRALNEDMPYNRFLLLQIAADQIVGATDREDLAALGFLTLGRRFLGVMHDIIDDRIDTLMRGTQALTVSCARCHDHKFDPIPTEDYYSLYGVFAGSSERLIALDTTSTENEEQKKFWEEHEARLAKLQSTFETKREEFTVRLRDQVGAYLAALLDVENLPSEEFYEIRQAEDLNPTIVRQWQAYLFRCGENDPVFGPWNRLASFFQEKVPLYVNTLVGMKTALTMDPPSDVPVNPLVAAALSKAAPQSMPEVAGAYAGLLSEIDREWREVLKAALESEYAAPPGFSDPAKEELRRVLYGPESPARVPNGAIVDLEWFFDEPTRVELGKLQKEIDKGIVESPARPRFAVTLEDRPTQRNPRVLVRGNPANKGKEIPRRFLEILAGDDRVPFERGSGRLELAQAIASRENPLTARVIVNRVWARHFGTGLVATLSDFGTRSEAPSHPELLDWLALRFMDDGWSLKKIHRLILLSSVYRQGAELPRAEGENGDPNPVVSIDPENRLYWKFNRTRLDFEALRDSVLFVSGALNDAVGGVPEKLTDSSSRRRTLYGYIDRQFLPGLLRVFDFPNPDMHSPQRYDTTVPQQALYFLNSPFLQEQARALAARVGATGEVLVPEKVRTMYELAYQREPNASELEFAGEFIATSITEPIREPPPPNLADWSYGYGKYATEENRVIAWSPLPHFTGAAFQGGSKLPDDKLGWVQLSAKGGHAGNDLDHASIRRWISPGTGTVSIAGTLCHGKEEGNGIRGRIVSSRSGSVGEWLVHNASAETRFDKVEVGLGDTLDFVVDFNGDLQSDEFTWVVELNLAKTSPEPEERAWNSETDFSGPLDPAPVPLSPWEKYAQALLCSNEFSFVD